MTDVGDLIDWVAGSGARPIGLLDSLRYGPLDDPATRGSLTEVAAGLGAYARQRGVPIVGGELTFDRGGSEPLITVLGVGIVSHDDLRPIDQPASDPAEPRPFARADWIDAVNADDANRLPRDNTPEAQRALLLRVVASAALCDKSWVTDQFDRYLGGHTVLAQPEDAGMIRFGDRAGLALTLDSSPRMAALNPYLGAQHALAEAYRSGSFARGTGEATTLPAPLVAMVGVLDDVATRTPMGFAEPGDEIWLLGETREELSGTIWAEAAHCGHLGGMPPRASTSPPRSAWQRCSPRPLASGSSPRPTTCRTAGSRRRSSSRACGAASVPRWTWAGETRPSSCTPSRPPGCWFRSPASGSGS